MSISAYSIVPPMKKMATAAVDLDDGAWNDSSGSLVPGRGCQDGNRDEGQASCARGQDYDGVHYSVSTDESGGWAGYDGITSSHSGGGSPPHGGQRPRTTQEGNSSSGKSLYDECEGGDVPTSSPTTDGSGRWEGFGGSGTASADGSVLWGEEPWKGDYGGETSAPGPAGYVMVDTAAGRDQDGSRVPQLVGDFCRNASFESFVNGSGDPQHAGVPAQPGYWDTTEALADVQVLQ